MINEANATPKIKKLPVYLALASAIFLYMMWSAPVSNAVEMAPSFVINEVLYDPEGGDSGKEWIEFKNISDEPKNLNGWSIQTAGSFFTTKKYLGNVTVLPGELALAGGSTIPGVDMVISFSFPNGGSDTDGIRLVNQNNQVVDTLLYDTPNTNELRDDNAHIAEETAPDVTSGNSLARHSDIDTDNSLTDFKECSILTPGEENLFAPIAKILEPSSSFINESITIDGSESSDLDGSIEQWDWKIEQDGEIMKRNTTETFTHTFTQEGDYTISLTVADNDNLAHTDELLVTIEQDPENPIITTISEAKSSEMGSILTIEATISSPPGIPTEKELYAQGESEGIRLKVPSEIELIFGDTYRITGEIGSTYGEVRLDVTSVLPSENKITPKITSVPADKIDEKMIGTLITTEFVIDRKNDRYFYSEAHPSGNKTIVYIPEHLSLDIPKNTSGQTIHISGIASRYGTNTDGTAKIRIIPRFEDEVRFVSAQGVLGTTGASLIPYLATLATVTITILLRRIFS